MMRSRLLFLLFLASAVIARGSNTLRDWKTESGTTYTADLVSYDEAAKLVELRFQDDTVIRVAFDDLSVTDRAWLLQWTEFAEEMQAKLKEMGGVLSVHTGKGAFPIDYWVYQPPLIDVSAVAKPPMLILFHPNGKGHREIIRYLEAAKATGLTLVSCDYFRNTPEDIEDSVMLERFKELLPQIEATVPHDEMRMFMGGCSGGAMRSFQYSAQVTRPWAGIYSNCGWMGGEMWYHLPFPAMRVAMVNGNQDPRGDYQLKKDTVRLQQAGCKISVHMFEGGHQVPPPSVQEKAFRWLLSDE
jgi:predicted esterase